MHRIHWILLLVFYWAIDFYKGWLESSWNMTAMCQRQKLKGCIRPKWLKNVYCMGRVFTDKYNYITRTTLHAVEGVWINDNFLFSPRPSWKSIFRDFVGQRSESNVSVATRSLISIRQCGYSGVWRKGHGHM